MYTCTVVMTMCIHIVHVGSNDIMLVDIHVHVHMYMYTCTCTVVMQEYVHVCDVMLFTTA